MKIRLTNVLSALILYALVPSPAFALEFLPVYVKVEVRGKGEFAIGVVDRPDGSRPTPTIFANEPVLAKIEALMRNFPESRTFDCDANSSSVALSGLVTVYDIRACRPYSPRN